MIYRVMAALAIFLLSSSVLAARSWENENVKLILVHDNASSGYSGLVNVYMYTDMNPAALPPCVTNSVYKSHFVIDLSRNGANAMYSTLLAAYMAGKKLTISVNQECREGIALVRNIYLGEL